MSASAATMTVDPMFLRHDLMIERARLEMAIEDIHHDQPDNNSRPSMVAPLERRLQRVLNVLERLPA